MANFHKTFETRPIMLYNLCPDFMANGRSHKPGKFHQYSICTFLLTDLQNPRSSRFGPRLSAFSSVTPRIKVQLGAPPVWRKEPLSTLKSNSQGLH